MYHFHKPRGMLDRIWCKWEWAAGICGSFFRWTTARNSVHFHSLHCKRKQSSSKCYHENGKAKDLRQKEQKDSEGFWRIQADLCGNNQMKLTQRSAMAKAVLATLSMFPIPGTQCHKNNEQTLRGSPETRSWSWFLVKVTSRGERSERVPGGSSRCGKPTANAENERRQRQQRTVVWRRAATPAHTLLLRRRANHDRFKSILHNFLGNQRNFSQNSSKIIKCFYLL